MDTPKGTIVWTIYCHTHVESGRRYIGLTKKTMKQRWNQHILNAKSKTGKGCQHFWNAIKKYGKDAFSHQVLSVSLTVEEGNWFEKFWILMFDTTDVEKGFNLSKGGNHTPHPVKKDYWSDPDYRAAASFRSKKLWRNPSFRINHARVMQKALNTSDYKAKQSQSQKQRAETPDGLKHLRKIANPGKILTPEHRAKISANDGTKNPETLRKISEAVKTAWQNPIIRNRMLEAFQKRSLPSPETRTKISAAGMGRTLSTGTKEKIALKLKKTHCKYGHSLEDALVYQDGKRVHRRCRTCKLNKR